MGCCERGYSRPCCLGHARVVARLLVGLHAMAHLMKGGVAGEVATMVVSRVVAARLVEVMAATAVG